MTHKNFMITKQVLFEDEEGNNYETLGQDVYKLYGVTCNQIFSEFELGDEVRCIKVYADNRQALNKVGRVISILTLGTQLLGVEFYEYINGHSSDGLGKMGHCWNIAPDHLKLVTKRKVQDSELISKFKVGDKVKLLGTKSICVPYTWDKIMQDGYKKGDICIVNSIFKDRIDVTGNKTGSDIFIGTFKSQDLELVSPSKLSTSTVSTSTEYKATLTHGGVTREVKQYEVNKMELKNCKKENLKEAKKQYEAEKKNEEIAYAKKEMARLTDNINTIDRQIVELLKEKELYRERLKPFNTK